MPRFTMCTSYSFCVHSVTSMTCGVMDNAISTRMALRFTRLCCYQKHKIRRKTFGGLARNHKDTSSALPESRARSFPIRFLSNPISSSPKFLNPIDRSYSIWNITAKGGSLIERETNYSHLLTKATASQLKGDIEKALGLANKALSIQKKLSTNGARNVQDEEIADTLLFLGKLNLLDGSIENAVELFSESRDLIKRQQQQYHPQISATHNDHPLRLGEKRQDVLNGLLRKEYVALSHLASAKGRLLQNGTPHEGSVSSIEADFQEALEGLAEICGWEDGMTNHTAHEWALYCKHIMNDPEKAIQILSNMKEELSKVFGYENERVLQLNGEMAQLWRMLSEAKEKDDIDACKHTRSIDNVVVSSSSSISLPDNDKALAEEKAMALLEEALEGLPPNSPEARRIFMQLEEWRETRDKIEGPTSCA